jgi:RecJ-like exonuclease
MKCERCFGTGHLFGDECAECDGSGYVCDICGDPLPIRGARLCDQCWRKANLPQPEMYIRDAPNYPDEREGK